MRKLIVLLLAAMLLCCSTANAFDGKRKGFVLGGGLGFSPIIHWSVEDTWNYDGAGVAVNMMIGYAWDERNMLVYEGNVAVYTEDDLRDDETVGQGVVGVYWHHYFSEDDGGLITVLGIGLQRMCIGSDCCNNDGVGYAVGLGYEFKRHWQVGLYLTGGKTTSGGLDFGHTNLNLIVSGVAF